MVLPANAFVISWEYQDKKFTIPEITSSSKFHPYPLEILREIVKNIYTYRYTYNQLNTVTTFAFFILVESRIGF